MEEAPENGKESSQSASANGMNGVLWDRIKETHTLPSNHALLSMT
jgi:hypothetical protein